MPKLPADEEFGSPGPKARIQTLQRQYYGIPRLLRFIVIAAVLLLVARDLGIRIQGDLDYKQKILPTDFGPLLAEAPDALWQPQQAIRERNGTHIGNRYIFMRHLGTGNEGSASLYVDVPTGEVVVVKTWLGPLKNIRNFVPPHLRPIFAHYTEKYPSEIEASLLLENFNRGNDTAVVPVKDYFVLRHDLEEWSWAMVTPFLEGGTLRTLAEATKVHERTPQKLDKIFRPAFTSLLEKLGGLHSLGYCHDDIKSDNVFIANTTHWLLGDLGNVRHVSHPWHATGRWKRENQEPDCEENDLRRLLKTYMTFLREAAASRPAFDSSFIAQDQAWSRLYWDYVHAPVSAHALATMSRALRSGDDAEANTEGRVAAESEACLARRIDRELTFWTVETTWLDWLPFRGC